jgi:hypothetical protein
MKARAKSVLLAACIAFVTGVGAGQAEAQESRSSLPVRTERNETSERPNRQLLRAGAWTLGVSYVPALVVAIKSERRGDDYLYYPVVGPWMDLAHRGECATCSRQHETLNEGLLIADGVFQGVGALQIVGAFLLPERQTPETESARRAKRLLIAREQAGAQEQAGIRLRLRPVRLSGGYGLQATAKF